MIVLVTGAARGLGLCLTKKFADEGHTVIAAARNPDKASALARLAEGNGRVRVERMDVSDWDSVQECARRVKDSFSHVDAVINNAGVLYESDRHNRIMYAEVEALKNTMAVNVEGPILVLRAFYPLLLESVRPLFYIITSESTINGHWHGIPLYSLSKVAAGKAAGIIGASVEEKFQVLAVHPGRMDTDMGRATAQIMPEESAAGIYGLASGAIAPDGWYVDYLGKKMEA